jgi:hypothetical protein
MWKAQVIIQSWLCLSGQPKEGAHQWKMEISPEVCEVFPITEVEWTACRMDGLYLQDMWCRQS